MNDNKYNYIDTNTEDSKRMMRRKKRKRERTLAFVILLIFVLIIVGAISLAILKFKEGKKPISESAADEIVTSTTIEPIDEEDINSAVTNLTEGEAEVIVKEPDPKDLEPSEEEKFEEAVHEYVSSLPIEDKVAGLFIVTPESITNVKTVIRAGEGTKAALEKYPVGGIIYATKNINSEAQFKEMLSNTISMSKYPIFLTANEELNSAPIGNALKYGATKSEREIGNTMNPKEAYDQSSIIADYLSKLGINLNLGITCDLVVNDDNNTLGTNVFGLDPVINAQMVARAVEAYEEKNVNTALKFFPGQATGTQDTASGIATSFRSKEEIDQNETTIFLSGIEAGADALVISHVSVPELVGDSTQCSLSKALMTDYIRVEKELDKVIVITDDMTKAAISEYYDSAESTITALKAGADMILKPANFEESYKAVLEAVQKGVISEKRIDDSLTRIYLVKFKGLTSDEVRNKFTN